MAFGLPDRSLQARLAWRLGLVLCAAMLLLTGNLAFYALTTLDDLDDASLLVQAQQIERYIADNDGTLRLELPQTVQDVYRNSGDGYLFALIDRQGRILHTSGEKARLLMASLPADIFQRDEAIFRLPDSEGRVTPYLALLRRLPAHNDARLVVAQGYLHQDVLVDTLLSEFIEHIGWTLPLILALALAISLWTIRSSLKPVKALSARAAAIGPTSTDIRLPVADVPDEIMPFVNAINSALDRLQIGFELQRQFTANAAHELRTPLAVLTARLDELDDASSTRQLREDVDRMNRLVEQLLKVSRLDATTVRLDESVELNTLAADVVAFLAPLAIAMGKTVALVPHDTPVHVAGSAVAINDALRNLVENAMAHTWPGSEVTVSVGADGAIAVRDHGPGVPEALQAKIFQRFYRSPGTGSPGAGLGLAIVAQTAAAHGGSVDVHNCEDGGARFTLRLNPR